MTIRIPPVVLLSCLLSACTQDNFWISSHAYLDQAPPGEVPQRFTPPHLCDSGYFPIGRIAFSADGKEFYFGSNNEWYSNRHQQLNWFRFVNNRWQGPLLLNHLYGQPTFSIDGKLLYVTDNNGIHQMHRTDTGWSKPEPFLKRSYVLYNYMPVKSGRAYVGSNGTWGQANDAGSWKFAVMPANPLDSSIKNLGAPLNSTGFNGDLYIAPDESYMIISAKETKDYECELWISFRRANDTWTAPLSLGAAINDGLAHRFGQYVTPDGKYLFYIKGTSDKDCWLYWVRFDGLLAKMKQQAGL
ncbi:MAG: hypothetical protein QM731_01385 [Chitinophagaceae bacterium]